MKVLFEKGFILKQELTAVTGILAGGAKGNCKNHDGTLKFTRAINSNELFSKECTPYVYPLLKAHKLSLEQLLSVKPNEVVEKIPLQN